MITDERICDCGILKVKVKNINEVSEEEYALLRKESFGGSDASILCGVNLYKNIKQNTTKLEDDRAFTHRNIIEIYPNISPNRK